MADGRNLSQQLDALDAQLMKLRAAPMLAKAAEAEETIRLTRNLLADLLDRVAHLERKSHAHPKFGQVL